MKNITLKHYFLLTLICSLVLNITALVFQYGFDMQPCVKCIDQRIVFYGISLASLIGLLTPNKYLQLVFSTSVGVIACYGISIAKEHLTILSDSSSLFYSCNMYPNLPIWLPLHEWIPAIFMPTGSCGDINFTFLSLNMVEWVAVWCVIFLISSLSYVYCKISTFKD